MNILFYLAFLLNPQALEMKVISPAFDNGTYIPVKYTCVGDNVSPPFSIINIPLGTVKLALIAEDPDGENGTVNHWLLWNIEASTSATIAENTAPGIEGLNSKGKQSYMGPCPPAGKGPHHYHFIVFALDQKLSLPAGSDKITLLDSMRGHVLAKAEVVGLCANTK